jgi:nitroreductase
MTSLPISQVNASLQWRYATKKFDPKKKIDSEHFESLVHALTLSPSSFGLQPWKFYVVNHESTRAALREASWNQPQVTDASHYVVLAARLTVTPDDVTQFISYTAQVRQLPEEKLEGYKEMILGFLRTFHDDNSIQQWCIRQAYIALGMILHHAAMLRIDSCPMEGFDPSQYSNILSCKKEKVHPVVAIALGYRASDDSNAALTKVRFPDHHIVKTI